MTGRGPNGAAMPTRPWRQETDEQRSMSKTTGVRDETKLASGGRDPDANFGIVNPPVYHASTVTRPTPAAWRNRDPMTEAVDGDRKRVGEGKRVSVGEGVGGQRSLKKKK